MRRAMLSPSVPCERAPQQRRNKNGLKILKNTKKCVKNASFWFLSKIVRFCPMHVESYGERVCEKWTDLPSHPTPQATSHAVDATRAHDPRSPRPSRAAPRRSVPRPAASLANAKSSFDRSLRPFFHRRHRRRRRRLRFRRPLGPTAPPLVRRLPDTPLHRRPLVLGRARFCSDRDDERTLRRRRRRREGRPPPLGGRRRRTRRRTGPKRRRRRRRRGKRPKRRRRRRSRRRGVTGRRRIRLDAPPPPRPPPEARVRSGPLPRRRPRRRTSRSRRRTRTADPPAASASRRAGGRIPVERPGAVGRHGRVGP